MALIRCCRPTCGEGISPTQYWRFTRVLTRWFHLCPRFEQSALTRVRALDIESVRAISIST
jgi:hypothetical protein